MSNIKSRPYLNIIQIFLYLNIGFKYLNTKVFVSSHDWYNDVKNAASNNVLSLCSCNNWLVYIGVCVCAQVCKYGMTNFSIADRNSVISFKITSVKSK